MEKDNINITLKELEEIEKLISKYNTQDNNKANTKSIGKNKSKEKKVETKKSSLSKRFYSKVVLVLLTISMAISLASYTLKDISDGGKINEAMPIIVEEAKDNLKEAGIIAFDDDNIIINMTYIKQNNQNIEIDNPSVSEAYAYKRVFEEYNLCDDDYDCIATLMTYNNGKNRYKDWDDFCLINNLTTKEGKPSIKAFYETSKEEILTAYDNNEVNDIVTDIEVTNTKTK